MYQHASATLANIPGTLALVPVQLSDQAVGTPGVDLSSILEAAIGGLRANTRKAYGLGLRAFAEFIGIPSAEAAVQMLAKHGPASANVMVLRYTADLKQRGRAAATINSRLSAIRWALGLLRAAGRITWTLSVKSEKTQGLRDTRGPGEIGVKALMAQAASRRDAKGLRDYVMLRLLHDTALRRFEVVGLDLEHLDLEGERAWILGKGRTEREPVTLPQPTKEAIEAWIAVRGTAPGPLFISLDRKLKGQMKRLSLRSVNRVLTKLGIAAGVKEARPHALRHAAITKALDATGGRHTSGPTLRASSRPQDDFNIR